MTASPEEVAQHWVQRYKGGVWALNQWSTPGPRSDFDRGYKGAPLRSFEGGPSQAYQVGKACRVVIDLWCAELQAWHDRH